MTVKELMKQVNVDRVFDAFLLLDYSFSTENFEKTFIEKYKSIPMLRELIKEYILLFTGATPTPHTIFIISKSSDDYENRWKKDIYAFMVNDAEAFELIDDSEEEASIPHYGFANLPAEIISTYTIAKVSLEEFGKEICAAKILSEVISCSVEMLSGIYNQKEDYINKMYGRLGKPIDKKESKPLEDFIKEREDKSLLGMTDEEKVYHYAKKHFEEETKEIIQRFQNRVISDIQKLCIAAIKNEYEQRMNTIENEI